MEATAIGMGPGYAESRVVACVHAKTICNATANNCRGSDASNSSLLYTIPGSVWPPNSFLNKIWKALSSK